ncbi:hypothetical protein [Maridesulfovibrio sp.]|uniref:hypothetical protein n=1 Tax=Maridesulfovibrio sp. TaxID=2795000 RepID=UPI003BABA5D0
MGSNNTGSTHGSGGGDRDSADIGADIAAGGSGWGDDEDNPSGDKHVTESGNVYSRNGDLIGKPSVLGGTMTTAKGHHRSPGSLNSYGLHDPRNPNHDAYRAAKFGWSGKKEGASKANGGQALQNSVLGASQTSDLVDSYDYSSMFGAKRDEDHLSLNSDLFGSQMDDFNKSLAGINASVEALVASIGQPEQEPADAVREKAKAQPQGGVIAGKKDNSTPEDTDISAIGQVGVHGAVGAELPADAAPAAPTTSTGFNLSDNYELSYDFANHQFNFERQKESDFVESALESWKEQKQESIYSPELQSIFDDIDKHTAHAEQMNATINKYGVEGLINPGRVDAAEEESFVSSIMDAVANVFIGKAVDGYRRAAKLNDVGEMIFGDKSFSWGEVLDAMSDVLHGLSPSGMLPTNGINPTAITMGGRGRSWANGPKYGNWGGQLFSGGLTGGLMGLAPAVDSADAAYERHDKAYAAAENDWSLSPEERKAAIEKADRELVSDLEKIGVNSDNWDSPPKAEDKYASELFSVLARIYF